MLGSSPLGATPLGTFGPSTFAPPTHIFTVSPGNYVLTGASQLDYYDLQAQPMAVQVTLSSIIFGQYNRTLIVSPTSFALAGSSAAMNSSYNASAQPGSYTLYGSGATLLATRKLNGVPTSYAVQGVARLIHSYPLNGSPAAFATTYNPAGMFAGYYMPATAATIQLMPQIVRLAADRAMIGSPESYLISGVANLKGSRSLMGVYAPFLLNANPANLARSRGEASLRGTYTLDGEPATLGLLRKIMPPPVSYAMSGRASALTWSRMATLQPATITINGRPAAMSLSFLLNLQPGVFALTGAATAAHGYVMITQAGSLQLLPQSVDLDYSGVDIPAPVHVLTYTEPDCIPLPPYEPASPSNGLDAELCEIVISTSVAIMGRTLIGQPTSIVITGSDA